MNLSQRLPDKDHPGAFSACIGHKIKKNPCKSSQSSPDMGIRGHATTSSCDQPGPSILLEGKGDLDLTEASTMAAGEPNINFSSSRDPSSSHSKHEEDTLTILVSQW